MFSCCAWEYNAIVIATQASIIAHGKAAGLSDEDAKSLAKGIISGAIPASAILGQGITNAAANLAAALQGAKLQSSIASVKEAGGKDDYIGMSAAMARGKTAADKERLSHFDGDDEYVASERKKAGAQATADKTRFDLDNNQELTDNVVNRTVEAATAGYFGKQKEAKRQEAIKQLTEVGALQTDSSGKPLTDENGRLKATTGIAFSNAFASLGALDMERGKQFMVAGTSMTMDRGRGGEIRIRATSTDTTERGEKLSYEGSGMLGDAVGASLYAGASLLAADRAVKTFSPSKRGIFERVWSKTENAGERLTSGSSSKPFDNSANKTTNGNHAQNNTHPNENIHNKTTSHDKTPSLNDRLTGNYNTKTPETKSWYKEIGKSFAKTKAGKFLGGAAAVVGLSSLAGAAEEGYEGYMGDSHTTVPPQSAETSMSTTDAAVIMGTSAAINGATAMYGAAELKATQQTAGKLLAKDGTKFAGKMASKLIPGVGLAVGEKGRKRIKKAEKCRSFLRHFR